MATTRGRGSWIFARDIDRLCRYFAKQGVETDPIGLAHEMWEEQVGF